MAEVKDMNERLTPQPVDDSRLDQMVQKGEAFKLGKMSRRGFGVVVVSLFGAGVGTLAAERVGAQELPLSAKIIDKDPQKILQLTGLVLSELGKAYHSDTDPLASDKATEALGYQISNAYQAADGFGYIWFQKEDK